MSNPINLMSPGSEIPAIAPGSPRRFSTSKLFALGLIHLVMATNLWAGKPVTLTAPTGLTATAISTNAIKLAWQDTSSNESGFIVDRALSASGPWTVGIATVNVNVTVYTNTSLTSGTTFYFRVYSYNSRGNSSYSSLASATTFTAVTPCSFTLSASSASFPSAAASGSVFVTTGSGCSWTASSAAAWISITSGGSGSGSGTVGYSVTANTSTSLRSGTINVAGQVFTVTQAGLSPCTFSLSTISASYGSAGG